MRRWSRSEHRDRRKGVNTKAATTQTICPKPGALLGHVQPVRGFANGVNTMSTKKTNTGAATVAAYIPESVATGRRAVNMKTFEPFEDEGGAE